MAAFAWDDPYFLALGGAVGTPHTRHLYSIWIVSGGSFEAFLRREASFLPLW